MSLDTLGASRDTSVDQAMYLVAIATRFQKVASLALNAKYWGNDIFERHADLKLVTLMVNRSERFSKDIEMRGHTHEFEVERTKAALQVSTPAKPPVQPPVNLKLEGVPEKVVERKLFPVRYVDNHDDIGDILYDNKPLPAPKSHSILQWLTKVYRDSRWFELGTFDPSLLAITMREQSTNSG